MTSLQVKLRHFGILRKMTAVEVGDWILADVTAKEVLYDFKGFTFVRRQIGDRQFLRFHEGAAGR